MKIQRFIHYRLLKFLRLGLKYPGRLFFLVIIASTFFLIGLFNLQVTYKTDKLLDQSMSTYDSLNTLNNEFKRLNEFHLLVESKEKWTSDKIKTVKEIIYDRFIVSYDYDLNWSPFEWRRVVLAPWKINYSKVVEKNNIYDFEVIPKHPLQKLFFGKNNQSIYFSFSLKDDSTIEKMMFDYNSIKADLSKFGLSTSIMGEPVYEYYMKSGNSSMGLVNFFAVIVICTFLYIAFKSPLHFFLFAIVIIPTMVIVHGLMGFLGDSLNLLSLGIFLILLVSVIEDFYFTLTNIQMSGKSWIKNFRKTIWPGFLTSWTTIVGFGSLAVIPLNIIKKFGLYLALGAAIEWFMIFIFLPSFFKLYSPWLSKIISNSLKKDNSEKFQKIIHFKVPRILIYFLIALVPISIYCIELLNYNTTPAEFFSKNHPLNINRQSFLKNIDYDVDFHVIFLKEATQEKKDKIVESIKNISQVTGIDSFSQTEKDFFINVSEADKKSFLFSLKDNSKVLERYFGLTNANQERITVFLNTSKLNEIRSIQKKIDSECGKDCFVSGSIVSFAELSELTTQGLKESFVLGLAIVFITLFLTSLSIKYSLFESFIIAALALVSPSLMILLAFTQKIEMNLVTILCFSGLLGIAGDNIFQYLFIHKNKKSSVDDFKNKFQPSLYICLTMSCLSTCFVLSDFYSVKILGVWLASGFIIGIFVDYFVLKSFLFDRK